MPSRARPQSRPRRASGVAIRHAPAGSRSGSAGEMPEVELREVAIGAEPEYRAARRRRRRPGTRKLVALGRGSRRAASQLRVAASCDCQPGAEARLRSRARCGLRAGRVGVGEHAEDSRSKSESTAAEQRGAHCQACIAAVFCTAVDNRPRAVLLSPRTAPTAAPQDSDGVSTARLLTHSGGHPAAGPAACSPALLPIGRCGATADGARRAEQTPRTPHRPQADAGFLRFGPLKEN